MRIQDHETLILGPRLCRLCGVLRHDTHSLGSAIPLLATTRHFKSPSCSLDLSAPPLRGGADRSRECICGGRMVAVRQRATEASSGGGEEQNRDKQVPREVQFCTVQAEPGNQKCSPHAPREVSGSKLDHLY